MEKVSQFGESLKAFWEGLSRKARFLLLGGIAAVILLIVILTAYLGQKNYIMLYNDLTPTEYTQVMSVLSEQGLDTQTNASGAILVNEKDADRARMQLAASGFRASLLDGGYSPGLTATQSDKNYMQKEELQRRLQTSIETYDEVAQAIVTISMPERSAFALQTDVIPTSASVLINKRPGRQLTTQQIQGILNLVKNGVPGLEEENISIADENGDLKTALAVGQDASNTKLSLTEEVNTSARNRALSVLQPVYGSGNVQVAVNSVLDTDSRITESTTYNPYDPENPQNNPTDYTEHTRQKVDATGGVAEGVPGANDNVGTPQYGEQNDDLANTASYSSHDIYDYLVGSTKEQIVKEGLQITDATAAVVVNSNSLADGERDQIIALVSGATGIPVEKVTVQNFEFAKGGAIEAGGGGASAWTPARIALLSAALFLLLAGLVFLILFLMRKKKREEEELLEEEILYDEDGMPLVDLLSEGEDFEPITVVESTEQKLRAQIKDLADSDPEVVAQLLKTWLSSSV